MQVIIRQIRSVKFRTISILLELQEEGKIKPEESARNSQIPLKTNKMENPPAIITRDFLSGIVRVNIEVVNNLLGEAEELIVIKNSSMNAIKRIGTITAEIDNFCGRSKQNGFESLSINNSYEAVLDQLSDLCVKLDNACDNLNHNFSSLDSAIKRRLLFQSKRQV